MKTKLDFIFLGFIMILAGGLAMAQQQGWLSLFTSQFWIVGFGALGLVFFVRYLLAGLRQWGRLFPSSIFLALAGMLWLNAAGYRAAWIIAPLFAALSIPLIVAFGLDIRKNWWALFAALVFIMFGVAIVTGNGLSLDLLGAIGMFAIAIPFILVYLADHKKWWALIPAFSLAVSGISMLLSDFVNRWVGAIILLAISALLFYAAHKAPQNWWAIIPAGFLGSIGITTLLTHPALGGFAQSTFPAAFLFLGWAATFGLVWRKREEYPTTWARIPALIAGIVAIVLLAVGSVNQYGLMVVFIVGGLLLIYRGLKSRKEDQVNKQMTG